MLERRAATLTVMTCKNIIEFVKSDTRQQEQFVRNTADLAAWFKSRTLDMGMMHIFSCINIDLKYYI